MIFKSGRSAEQLPERLSDKAVAFGQHIVELEQGLAQAHDQIAKLSQRATLAEASAGRLREEKDELKRERDDYQRRWLETQTKLRTAGNIIIDAISDVPETERYRARPASMRAVDKAVATRAAMEGGKEPPPTVPDFLMAGPREDDDKP